MSNFINIKRGTELELSREGRRALLREIPKLGNKRAYFEGITRSFSDGIRVRLEGNKTIERYAGTFWKIKK